jgi:vancomycin permeability regulator SanA
MPRSLRLLRRLLPLVLLACMCGYAFAAWRIVDFGARPSAASADAALVLGAAAWGSRPSPVYRERIVEAVSLYKAGRVRWIILTGGSSRPGFPSEALVGRRFCVSKGVPVEATLLDQEPPGKISSRQSG